MRAGFMGAIVRTTLLVILALVISAPCARAAVADVDVLFAVDCTGSMGDEIAEAKTSATYILETVKREVELEGGTAAFGICSFMDYTGYHGGAPHSAYYAQYGSTTYGDYPYRLDHDISTNTTSVANAIQSLSLGWGADEPQNYTRILYESQFVGWRPGAIHLLVIFGDAVPHDIGFNGRDTGPDPGRDGVDYTDDDLDFETIVAQLAASNIHVLAIDSGYESDAWRYMAEQTAGGYFRLEDASEVPNAILELIRTSSGSGIRLRRAVVGLRTAIEYKFEADIYHMACIYAFAYKRAGEDEPFNEAREAIRTSADVSDWTMIMCDLIEGSAGGAAVGLVSWAGMKALESYATAAGEQTEQAILDHLEELLGHTEIDPNADIGVLIEHVRGILETDPMFTGPRDEALQALADLETAIPDNLPASFPLTQILDYIERADDAIMNSVTGERVLCTYDPDTKAVIYSLIGAVRDIKEQSEDSYLAVGLGGKIEQFTWYAGAIVAGGSYIAIKAGGVALGGVGVVPAELPAVGAAAAFWSAIVGTGTVCQIYTDEILYKYLMFGYYPYALAAVAPELEAESAFARETREFLLSLLSYEQAWPSLSVESVRLDDVVTSSSEDLIEATATISLKNTGSSPAAANVLLAVEGLNRTSRPCIVAYGGIDTPVTVEAGEAVSIPIRFHVPTADALCGAEEYNVRVYASLGPEVQQITFSWCIGSSAVIDLVSATTKSTTESYLSEGESRVATYSTSLATSTVVFRMEYEGSDFDLHLYDSRGRHTGRNSETGDDEIGIPGSSYSGSGENPEVIIVNAAGGQTFSVVVEASQVDGLIEGYGLTITEYPQCPPILAAVPCPVMLSEVAGTHAQTAVAIKEVGGHTGASDLAFAPQQLTGPGGAFIPASALYLSLPATEIAPGETVIGQLGIELPTAVPPGTYTGNCSLLSNAEPLSIPVTVELVALAATVTLEPQTLNLGSKGRWVTCYIELPEGCFVTDIDVASLRLQNVVSAVAAPVTIGDHDSDGMPDLMVKFSRSSLSAVLTPGEERIVALTGQLIDGTPIAGIDVIRVIE